jgi:hypothetical protein
MEEDMKYTKPNILSTVNATTNIMGPSKLGDSEDNGTINRSANSAYEADE